MQDPRAVEAACSRLGLPSPAVGRHRLYSGTVEGLAVSLPGWNYPVVFDLETGEVHYDNYGGQWGAQERLDDFLQAYTVEKAKAELAAQGYWAVEQEVLIDGARHIRLTADVH